MRENNKLISFLQVFAILLVVCGHSYYAELSGERPLFIKWVTSWHMPLFMFISGFLLKYSNRQLASIKLLGGGGRQIFF